MLLSLVALCALLVVCIVRWRMGLMVGGSLLLVLVGLVAWRILPLDAAQFPSPAPANLEGKVQLLGYNLDRSTYRPGETIAVTLYWVSLREMSEDYTVFVHLMEESGSRRFGQHDGWPVYGFTPTTRWEPGEIVVDRHKLAIDPGTPPGQYRILVGMYSLSTMRRLEVMSADVSPSDNAILLTPVEVQGAAP
jgi:hypothetical protein